MEILATLKGLEALTRSCAVEIVTDSLYLRDGATIWIKRWNARGWRTASRDSVKNEDLWRRVDAICQTHAIAWTWVRSHNGHPRPHRPSDE
jgi:ribonuclease HI